MARPVKKRRICELPKQSQFGPLTHSDSLVEMTVDEYETIRLIDYLNLSQEECANQMNVARTTVQSIYDSARNKLAKSLVDGCTLIIDGGSYDICPHANECCAKSCSHRVCGKDSCHKQLRDCKRHQQ